MPFYEYECSACKFYVEALQKISAPPLTKCPSCGKETLQRLISAPVFRLKGAGWYETDFKSDKENKRNLVDTGGDDKEPAAKSDSDDKKIKVRASTALKKVAARKAAKKKVAGKAAKKTASRKAPAVKKPAARKVAKPVKKVAKRKISKAKKSAKPAARKK